MAAAAYNPYNFTQLQLDYGSTGQLTHVHVIGWQVLILLLILITFCQFAQLGISLFKLMRR